MAIKGLVREHKLAPAELTERIPPTADLFVLAHMGILETSAEDWSLSIDGLVESPLEITFDNLVRRPKKVVETVHQCAGSPMNPKVPTRQIANVKWAGADLCELLADTGVEVAATHLSPRVTSFT